jgi:DNA-binding CsgD family transcriptional regulator
MATNNDYIDLIKAIGRQDYVIFNNDYKQELKKNPLLIGLWTVGRWFNFVVNTQSWSIELVTGDSREVIGQTPEEIIQAQSQFVAGFIHQEDFPFVGQAAHFAMEYVSQLPIEARPFVYVVFYIRAVRKDGTVITVQNQNIPVVFDEKNLPFIFANIITDISHIRPTNIPHAILINKSSGEQFHLDPKNLQLKPQQSLFTARELEVVQLLIKGYSSRKISEILDMSYETARTHRKNILTKAQVSNTSQLITFMLLNKIV